MQKELILLFPKRKKFSLRSISNHTLTIIQRLSQCLPFPESSGFLNYCSLPGSSKEVISHSASLLLSPQFSLSDAPSWELQGGDQSPLLPVGVGPDWRLALGPYLILWPLLVGWSIPPKSLVRIQPCRELEHQCEREPGIPSGGTPPHSSRDSFAPAWPSHLSGGSRGWCGWNLAGASRNVAETSNRESKHHTQRVGKLRFSTPAGPEELTLQALSP